MASEEPLLARLAWSQLQERDWIDLVVTGLPAQLACLSASMSERTWRPIKVFTMSTGQAGVLGLCVPFVDDDGLILDPTVLDEPADLANVVARQLAYMLYPSWMTLGESDRHRLDVFAALLGPLLLRELPEHVSMTDHLVDLVLSSLPNS